MIEWTERTSLRARPPTQKKEANYILLHMYTVINAAFDISLERNLSLSQPAVCKHVHSRAIWPNLFQRKGNLVRYVAHVEIQFPIFSRSVLRDTVIPARLDRASSGWGLDHVWPFLMDYPRDKIAVVDAVCMLHPAQEIQEGKESVYANRHPSGWYEWFGRIWNRYLQRMVSVTFDC